MTTSTINALNSTSATTSTSSASSTNSTANALTSETKAKLQALGVDTTNIKTEMQGQIALLQAQSAQKSQQNSQAQASKADDPIKASAKSLASQVGATVSDNASTSDILSAISSKISELKSSAGNDQTKLQQVAQYEQELTNLSTEYSSSEAQKSQVSSSLNGMANYNKSYQNLS